MGRPKIMTILIRATSTADAGLLTLLNRDVQQLHAEMEPGVFKSDPDHDAVAAFFAAKLALTENQMRIADASDGPKGYVWFEVQERSETPLRLARRRIYIHHLSVQAGARRQGIASMLLNHVEAEARARGITHVALDTWATNVPARSFFSARGFTAFNLSLGRQLA